VPVTTRGRSFVRRNDDTRKRRRDRNRLFHVSLPAVAVPGTSSKADSLRCPDHSANAIAVRSREFGKKSEVVEEPDDVGEVDTAAVIGGALQPA